MKSYLITGFWWHDPADSSRFLGSFTLGTSTHHSSNRRMESTEHQPHSAAWGSFYWNLAEGAGHSAKMEFDGIWELKSTWGSGYVTFGWFDMIWSTCFFSISRVSQQCHVQPEGFFTWTVPRVESSHGTSWNWSSNAATAKDCESQRRKNELNKNPTSSVIFN
jgi:hypothetical protein